MEAVLQETDETTDETTDQGCGSVCRIMQQIFFRIRKMTPTDMRTHSSMEKMFHEFSECPT